MNKQLTPIHSWNLFLPFPLVSVGLLQSKFGRSIGFMPGHASAAQHEILEEPEEGVQPRLLNANIC